MVDCALFILWDGDRALMEDRPDLSPGSTHFWVYPGGKVEPDETPAQAMVREAAEEIGVSVLGYAAMPGTFISKSIPAHKAHNPDGWRVHPFVVSLWRGTLPTHTLDRRHAPLDWRKPTTVNSNEWTCNYPVARTLLQLTHRPVPCPTGRLGIHLDMRHKCRSCQHHHCQRCALCFRCGCSTPMTPRKDPR